MCLRTGAVKKAGRRGVNWAIFCSFQCICLCNLISFFILERVSCLPVWYLPILGGGSIYFYYVSKCLHCCRSSRQWIPFKEKPYSFLACGAADSLCFASKEHLNLPWVQFREQFFAAGSGVWSVSSFTCSPSLALPQPWCGSAATRQLLARCRCPELFCKGLTLNICLLQGSICTALPLQKKSQPDMYSKPNIAPVLVCGAASGFFPSLTVGEIFK